MKIPKTLGACADKLIALREKKAKLAAAVKDIEKEERALKDHLIDNLPKSDAQGVVGKKAKVMIKSKQVPSVKDWGLLYKYIKRTNSWDLLQKRPSAPAWKARVEEGKRIPGVEAFTVVDVSITKL